MSKTYLLLGSDRMAIAKGVMEGPDTRENLRVKVEGGQAAAVAEHQIIIAMSEEPGERAIQCHLVEREGDSVILRKMMPLDAEFRRSLRMPVKFNSFIYPVDGSFLGRMALRSIDLSHGGVAFYAPPGLEIGTVAEVVIPVTVEPLIVKMQILRKQELNNGKVYYAAKFVELQDAEEDLICKAVFGIQLEIGREKEMPAI